MSLSSFLAELFEHGRVKVPPPEPHRAIIEPHQVRRLLFDRATVVALSFPGDPPGLDFDVSIWAAQQLYVASQLTVYRDFGAVEIRRLLAHTCPTAPSAVQHWSVDLIFAFLPDLIRLVRAASEQDPLLAPLLEWAADWPLSSVGVAGVVPKHVDAISAHAGLLQHYVDRILAKRDWSRLAHPDVATAARRSLGNHFQEWPEVAKALESFGSSVSPVSQ